MEIKGKCIVPGEVVGESIVSCEPISFLGDIDPKTGQITAARHPLKGISVKGKILVFPFGKGSTVGSYVIYQLLKNRTAPIAFLTQKADPIVAVGAIISGIPMMDDIDINKIPNGIKLSVNTDLGLISF
ncbi:MAG: aconitase X swivel domain-containing protein [Candidatus Thorarchaeota archaeon]